jgi:inorganic pyrophosphatase
VNIEKIPAGKKLPWQINVIVEIPMGGEPIKYEIDKESGAIFVDRFMSTTMFYPANYGFIPNTLGSDGDPLDVMVLSDIPVVPGAVIPCRPIGVLIMQDEAGGDEKVLAVPDVSLNPYYGYVQKLEDLPGTVLKKIEHFFSHYKDLDQGKWVKIERWADANEAARLIEEAYDRLHKSK